MTICILLVSGIQILYEKDPSPDVAKCDFNEFWPYLGIFCTPKNQWIGGFYPSTGDDWVL